ncbi:hypothetical protein P20429_1566 [Pseudoalteromonas sp. BSi20429]|jgi:hypothetical protein|uniref:Uncharacterized protein n=1 Tax=Pseudoalteromonas arctica A 37-1-2 TaxID=1117313 RepID=A0A290S4L9_9GAMM|nr:hypothetical protein PARC_a2361 [Pseudoalteromonas arctica A 37-1-2]GAA67451.1 hypothetical protein P20429_1566 [Pseudoalteromonas sp. BSi20429]
MVNRGGFFKPEREGNLYINCVQAIFVKIFIINLINCLQSPFLVTKG